MGRFVKPRVGAYAIELTSLQELNFFQLIYWIESKHLSKSASELSINDIQSLIVEFCTKNHYKENEAQLLQLSEKVKKFLKNSKALQSGPYNNFKIKQIAKEKTILEERKQTEQKERKELRNRTLRYGNIPFHGIFLFSKSDNEFLEDFFNNYVDDIDAITSNKIDIYFSKSDLSSSGYSVLQKLDLAANKKIILPSLIVWDKNYADRLIEVPLLTLGENLLLKILQIIAYEIDSQDHLSLLHIKLLIAFDELKLDKPRLVRNSVYDNIETYIFCEKIKSRIRKLVGGNLTDKAIELVKDELKSHMKSGPEKIKDKAQTSLDYLTIASSELKRNKDQWLAGLITLESLNVVRNRINQQILTMITSL